jgi:hypothetical protein
MTDPLEAALSSAEGEAFELHDICLEVVDLDLGENTITQAKLLVELGEARWVRSSSAVVKLVPPDHPLGDGEQFVEERQDGLWMPERKAFKSLMEST